jgi:hypothetical protein
MKYERRAGALDGIYTTVCRFSSPCRWPVFACLSATPTVLNRQGRISACPRLTKS